MTADPTSVTALTVFKTNKPVFSSRILIKPRFVISDRKNSRIPNYQFITFVDPTAVIAEHTAVTIFKTNKPVFLIRLLIVKAQIRNKRPQNPKNAIKSMVSFGTYFISPYFINYLKVQLFSQQGYHNSSESSLTENFIN